MNASPVSSFRRAATSGLILALSLAAGCGKKGPPLPPVPRGPLPPRDVVVRQIGDRAQLRFRVPEARGPNPPQQPARAELIRVSYPPGQVVQADPEVFRRRGRVVSEASGDPLPSGAWIVFEDDSWSELPAAGVRNTLRYAVRVLDRRGRASPLVVAPDLVPEQSVAAPDGLMAEPTSDGIRLVWQPDPAAQELGYNVYRGKLGEERSRAPLNAEPLSVPEYLDERAETGERYAYFVRVSLADGKPLREGPQGRSIEVLAEDRFPPAEPQGLVAVQEGAAVRLFWNPNPERDLAGYRVYRRSGDGDWVRTGPDPVEQPLYLDPLRVTPERLAYRVTAVDRATPPNESRPSAEFELDLGQEPASGEERP